MIMESGVIIRLHSIKTPEFRLHYTRFRRHYTSKFGIFDKFLQFTVKSFLNSEVICKFEAKFDVVKIRSNDITVCILDLIEPLVVRKGHS